MKETVYTGRGKRTSRRNRGEGGNKRLETLGTVGKWEVTRLLRLHVTQETKIPKGKGGGEGTGHELSR